MNVNYHKQHKVVVIAAVRITFSKAITQLMQVFVQDDIMASHHLSWTSHSMLIISYGFKHRGPDLVWYKNPI